MEIFNFQFSIFKQFEIFKHLKFNSNFKFQISNSPQNGFTLIELILYIVLVTMMLGTLIPFAWNVIEGGVKVSVEQEVYSQARYLSERIKKEIRDASAVTTCSSTELYLTNSVVPTNSIRFCYDGAADILTYNQGNPPANCPGATGNRIHSQDTVVTAFACTNYSGSSSDNAQITFTMTDNYSSTTRQEYNEAINMQFSAETRE